MKYITISDVVKETNLRHSLISLISKIIVLAVTIKKKTLLAFTLDGHLVAYLLNDLCMYSGEFFIELDTVLL